MRIEITRPNGYRGSGVDASCGQVVELPEDVAAGLIASGHAVAVGNPVPAAPLAVEVEHVAPVLNAVRNGSYTRGKKK